MAANHMNDTQPGNGEANNNNINEEELFPLLPMTHRRRPNFWLIGIIFFAMVATSATSVVVTRTFFISDSQKSSYNEQTPTTAAALPSNDLTVAAGVVLDNAPPPLEEVASLALSEKDITPPTNDSATIQQEAITPKIKITVKEAVDDGASDNNIRLAGEALANGNVSLALNLYRSALGASSPDKAPIAWQGLIHTLEEMGGEQGLSELKELTARWPDRADVYAALASVHMQLGTYNEAISYIERALTLADNITTSPQQHIAWQRARAIAIDRSGNQPLAREAYASLPAEAQDSQVRERLAWLIDN